MLNGDAISRRRRAAGLSQAELGHRLGATKQWVSHLETRCGDARLGTAIRIAQALGCDVSEIVYVEADTDGTDEPTAGEAG